VAATIGLNETLYSRTVTLVAAFIHPVMLA